MSKIFLRHTLTKKFLTFWTSLSLYIFTIWKKKGCKLENYRQCNGKTKKETQDKQCSKTFHRKTQYWLITSTIKKQNSTRMLRKGIDATSVTGTAYPSHSAELTCVFWVGSIFSVYVECFWTIVCLLALSHVASILSVILRFINSSCNTSVNNRVARRSNTYLIWKSNYVLVSKYVSIR